MDYYRDGKGNLQISVTEQSVIRDYGRGLYSEWDLWNALSGERHLNPMQARRVYILLGFIPFAGFPLITLPKKNLDN